MAKLIVTNDYKKTNLLIELADGSQVELNVHKEELLEALRNDEQKILFAFQEQPKIDGKDSMYEITFYNKSKDKVRVTGFKDKYITDETLDFALYYVRSTFGFVLVEVKRKGQVLTGQEVEEIIKKYPSMNRFQELREYFYGKE